MTDHPVPLRVLVVEDNEDLREVLPALIDAEGDLRCVAATASVEDIPALITRHAVQVAVLDLELGGRSALAALPALCAHFPATRFVIHSGHSTPEIVRKSREAGASGYVLKSGNPDDLTKVIRTLGSSLR